ncbi:hypothetical protein ACQR0V_02800 [Bradyrhizobium sp. HKCCYLS2058]|uniref:hypothetical protein n=1 Tax=unclassified Bradyrhizobium TaxID=2631580 RepID=UPI003EB770A3
MARLRKKCRRQVPQVQPNIRHSLRGGLFGCFALSSGTGLFAPVIREMPQGIFRELDTSIGVSGPHDLTVCTVPFVHARYRHVASTMQPPPPRLTPRDDREPSLFIEAGWPEM